MKLPPFIGPKWYDKKGFFSMKYNMDQKLKMVHEYLDDKTSTVKLSQKYGYDLAKIKYMIKL